MLTILTVVPQIGPKGTAINHIAATHLSRFQDGRIRVDWCSAPGRPDGLLSLDMPVQLASGLHSLGYCLSAADPVQKDNACARRHSGGGPPEPQWATAAATVGPGERGKGRIYI